MGIGNFIGRKVRDVQINDEVPSLDVVINFPLSEILEKVIKGFSDPADLRDHYRRLNDLPGTYCNIGNHFITFVDNHDRTARFLHKNPVWQQAVSAIGYILTSQGIPCLYYGTEQGFNGGGDRDFFVRECMFGGKWGAFDSTGGHFFDESNPIYQGIRSIAMARAREPALRYGRQQFRRYSSDGVNFGFGLGNNDRPIVAFSRILDSEEVLVAINLSGYPRYDYIEIDERITPPGSRMIELTKGSMILTAEEVSGRSCIRVPLEGHQIALFRNFCNCPLFFRTD